jgi:hypothetical protein
VLASKKIPGRPAHLRFVALLIGTQVKPTLLKHLEGTYGIDRQRLFPEISGFAEAVRCRTIDPLTLSPQDG